MLVTHDHQDRNLEDALRSLGAVLDAHLARAILIKEVDRGFVVRAQVMPALDQRIGGAWVPLERVFTDPGLAEQRRAAVARRGSGHVAGPIERALRAVGRMADEGELTGLTLIQHASDGGWLLWHQALPDGRPQLRTLTNDALEQLTAAAPPRRGAEEPFELVDAPGMSGASA